MIEGHADRQVPNRGAAAWIAGVILGATLLLTLSGAPGIPCLFHAMFHVPCPGCGMTRSLKALWSGDLASSFRYHPLGIPLFAGCLWGLVYHRALKRNPQLRFSAHFARRVWGLALAALLVVWAARLIDMGMHAGFFLP